jgi:hypothetical protein
MKEMFLTAAIQEANDALGGSDKKGVPVSFEDGCGSPVRDRGILYRAWVSSDGFVRVGLVALSRVAVAQACDVLKSMDEMYEPNDIKLVSH